MKKNIIKILALQYISIHKLCKDALTLKTKTKNTVGQSSVCLLRWEGNKLSL